MEHHGSSREFRTRQRGARGRGSGITESYRRRTAQRLTAPRCTRHPKTPSNSTNSKSPASGAASSSSPGRLSDLGRILRPGTVLKQKWRLDKLLGVGGMAVVYAATHRNGKRVAIKMLHEEHSRNADVKTRFLREGYLANAVDHAGAVSVIDDDVTEDGTVFLVMELLAGETLERRWERKVRRAARRRNALDRQRAPRCPCRGARQGARPPRHQARECVPHARREGEDPRLRHRSAAPALELRRRPSPGATMGTPAFMPPEQARGRWDEVDARSDVWATGATMFALLAGRFVHEAATLNEQLLAAMTRFAPPFASILPELTPEVATGRRSRARLQPQRDRWPTRARCRPRSGRRLRRDRRAELGRASAALGARRRRRRGRRSTPDPDESRDDGHARRSIAGDP